MSCRTAYWPFNKILVKFESLSETNFFILFIYFCQKTLFSWCHLHLNLESLLLLLLLLPNFINFSLSVLFIFFSQILIKSFVNICLVDCNKFHNSRFDKVKPILFRISFESFHMKCLPNTAETSKLWNRWIDPLNPFYFYFEIIMLYLNSFITSWWKLPKDWRDYNLIFPPS